MQKTSRIFMAAGAVLALGSPIHAGKVLVNQLGFAPNATKQAIYVEATDGAVLSLRKVDAPTTVVLALTPSEAVLWAPSAEEARKLDFSAVKDTGSYAIYENEVAVSATFRIAPNVYEDLLKASLKWFYYQRASTELLAEHAGAWARPAGHPDTLVLMHSTVGKDTISAPKGWYDAGDYGKYVVNSGVTMGTLYSLYEDFSPLFDTLTWNIPESGNKAPDLLDELRWNLDWMLAMQDTADGGVYHKLTSMNFCGFVMPAKDKLKRYVVMKTSAATYDFAAVVAQAARIYLKLGQAEEAARLYARAAQAFAWAEANSGTYFAQPTGMGTGEYGDKNDTDERTWAATNMARAWNDLGYSALLTEQAWTATAPGWSDVGALGTWVAMSYPEVFTNYEAARTAAIKAADDLLATAKASGYGISIRAFGWGSNSVAANQGIVLLKAYYLTQDRAYLDAAQALLDYLLGRNPLATSYVTGFGTKSPLNPHHRPSQADGVAAPVPGMLVGGANSGAQDVKDGSCVDYRVTGAPAKSYLDDECSYASNEVAINWNAPLAYLVGALHALNQGVSLPTGVVQPAPALRASSVPARLQFDGHGLYMERTLGDGSVRRGTVEKCRLQCVHELFRAFLLDSDRA